jgi:hypothetical protein
LRRWAQARGGDGRGRAPDACGRGADGSSAAAGLGGPAVVRGAWAPLEVQEHLDPVSNGRRSAHRRGDDTPSSRLPGRTGPNRTGCRTLPRPLSRGRRAARARPR